MTHKSTNMDENVIKFKICYCDVKILITNGL